MNKHSAYPALAARLTCAIALNERGARHPQLIHMKCNAESQQQHKILWQRKKITQNDVKNA